MSCYGNENKIFLSLTAVIIFYPLCSQEFNHIDLESRDFVQKMYTTTFPEKKRQFNSFKRLIEDVLTSYKSDNINSEDVISRMLKDEIKKYDINSRDCGELSIQCELIRIDASFDVAVRRETRDSVNKSYIADYIQTKMLENVYKQKEDFSYDPIVMSNTILANLWNGKECFTDEFSRVFQSLIITKNQVVEPDLDYRIWWLLITPKEYPIKISKERFYDIIISSLFYCSDFYDDVTLYTQEDPMYKDTLKILNQKCNYSFKTQKSDYMGVYVMCKFNKERANQFFQKYYK